MKFFPDLDGPRPDPELAGALFFNNNSLLYK